MQTEVRDVVVVYLNLEKHAIERSILQQRGLRLYIWSSYSDNEWVAIKIRFILIWIWFNDVLFSSYKPAFV